MNPAGRGLSRRELLRRSGTLAIVTRGRAASAPAGEEDTTDVLVCLTDEGDILAFCGKVDLGTGIRTALAQIVAEELDVHLDAVDLVLGETENVPDHGPTIASETIQITAMQLRAAAAQARRHLLSLASSVMASGPDTLTTGGGRVHASKSDRGSVSYGDLLRNQRIHLELDPDTPVKPVSQHRIVGTSVERTDIPDKVLGRTTYVHDVRVPDMLHGRVVRPPYTGLDSGEFIGRCLDSVDESSIAHIPGIVAVVVEGDFVGVVAEREEDAARAALALKVRWKPWTFGHDLDDLENALRAAPVQSRRLIDEGDVDAALARAASRLDRTYVWPYQLHGSIGPSCAVADVRREGITVWAGSQSPYWLRSDLSVLTGLDEHEIKIIRLDAAGCYGRNCADDVAADAVLLSKAVGRPVRVQLTREQENLWEPKGSAQLMDVSGALGPGGTLAAYDYRTRYPANRAPTLALLLTGAVPAVPEVHLKGDRSARPQYNYESLRVTVHDMAPLVRTGSLRGVAALPSVFAHESFIDELAEEAGSDPLEFRLRHMTSERAAAVTRATADRAGWDRRTGPKPQSEDAELLQGRGLAQAAYVHSEWPGIAAAWSACVAEVVVNRNTGEVEVTRMVVGQDAGMMINPAGVRHQLHGNVIQTTSRVLHEKVSFEKTGEAVNREWGTYPILNFSDLPATDVVLMERQDEPPLGVGESASLPSAAAIVNAVYDATGVRFRELPLTPDRVLAGLGNTGRPPQEPVAKRRRLSLAPVLAGLAGALTLGAIAFPTSSALAPIPRPDPAAYSRSTIERGERLAALGACAVCHTAEGGARLAGGVALPTPFGVVMTTNITPDVETGIGDWSYPAFARAMRKGLHRDGRNLYPAFPFPNFAKTTEQDLQALYAYLMAQPPVRRENAASRLVFPLNFRPLMAGWNLLFNRGASLDPDPAKSASWNRGRYLVDGLGHCGACHTPRNVFGAEKAGSAYLSGAVVDGWDAPALAEMSRAPIPWTEDALFAYLRHGQSPDHGIAAGPMAPVVQELGRLPDEDIRSMAEYLASLTKTVSPDRAMAHRQDALDAASHERHRPTSAAAKAYDGACAVCHDPTLGPVLFNSGLPLALSTKLHLDRPDNLLFVLLDGVELSAHGAMPGFGNAFDDRQTADLVRYLRQRFAPDKAPWQDLDTSIERVRTAIANRPAAR